MKDAVRGQYTLEFKQEAVRLVRGGESVSSVAKSLGISGQTLHNWVKADTAGLLRDVASKAVSAEQMEIQTRWTEASGRTLPKIAHSVSLESGRYLAVDVANFKTVVAAVRLVDCLKFPGISDGKLFRPNVRQSLGLTNKINKGMKQTLNGENPQYFFFYHNSITALCEKLALDPETHTLKLRMIGSSVFCWAFGMITTCTLPPLFSSPNTGTLPAAPRPRFPFREPPK